MVEYLFGLGQLKYLGEPHSEESNRWLKTTPDGMPHWVGSSEREIFSRIMFIDYGYFYDADHTWYYVKPGPFRIKLPATLVCENLDGEDFEFSFMNRVSHLILDEIFNGRWADCLKRSGYDEEKAEQARQELSQEEYPLYELFDRHRPIFKCFDDWVVVRSDESGKNVGEILLRPKTEEHIETILWQPPSGRGSPAD